MPLDPFHVYRPTGLAQKGSDPAVSVAPILRGECDDVGGRQHELGTRSGEVTAIVSAEGHGVVKLEPSSHVLLVSMNIVARSALPRAKALDALSQGLRSTRSGVDLNAAGYVSDFNQNLLAGVIPEDFEADLRQGSGRELDGKFRAAHSSSALAVNSFGPFRRHASDLAIGDRHDLSIVGFEQKCPVGLRRGTPPNLDLVLEGPDQIIGVESKCTEYLSVHAADFSRAYSEQIVDARRESGWFAEMQRLSEAPDDYRWLDAAQLIKHAFGLSHTYPDKPVQLLYLYWEPPNAHEFPVFGQHRSEVARFADRVAGSSPSFAAMSYSELWNGWASAGPPAWLMQHLARLEARYSLPI